MIGTFTPSDSALLLIDHQVGTMKLIKNIPLEVVKRNTLALAKTAKILGMPVVLTSSQEQNVQGPLLPELEGILPEAFAARVTAGRDRQRLERPELQGGGREDATAQSDHGGRHHGCLSGLPGHQRLPGRVSSPGRHGCVRFAVRHLRGDVPAADGTRRRGPDGHQHADGRTGAGLEPPRRRATAWHPFPGSLAENRLMRQPPNQTLHLTGPPSWFCAASRHCRRPGR